RQRPDHHGRERHRLIFLQAAHVPHVLFAGHRVDHRPAAEEEERLKNACVIRWNAPAENAPTPIAVNMYPSCETVEYASTRLMSYCTRPIDAAISAVSTPTIATISITIGACEKSTALRPTMYTPAVTS